MIYRLFVLIISVGLFVGCNSSERLLQKGQYDKAIEKAVKKLRKKPNNDKELYVLKEAYLKANSFDMDQIEFLEREGREENYVRIYHLYQRLDNRQDRIKTLPTVLMDEFTLIDYDEKLIASKEQAAEISYKRGIEYLESGGRENARKAYYEFERVRDIYSDYRDVNEMLRESQYLGTNQVLFITENNSEVVLPARFESELLKIGLSDLNDRWIQYSVSEDEEVQYDYFIVLNINNISVTPERLERKSITEKKEIQDGTKYVLDERGNVKKDSLGNDIREPNFVTVSAEISKVRQVKEAMVGGTLDYVDLRTDQLVKTENVGITAVFEHFSASFSGDERALSGESRDMINSEIIPFPGNEAMLLDAANLHKEHTKEIMYRNRNLLSSTY
ncbi:tetratricopeptide repeat protein [Gracilimonas halophila]|uniref:Tetratricopeptide repeat protein n=1 Tax=Gracilimonas halophila TaxID=1834464 RepID=A0ABW5JLW6_9BACT